MAQFKMPTLNTNQLKLYSEKPLLIIFLRQSDIVVFQVFHELDSFVVQLEYSHPIKESLVDALNECLEKVKNDKAFIRRSKILMLMDDCYLTMHRTNLSVTQLTKVHQSLEVEIDHLDEYDYDVTFSPSESKHVQTLLVYLIKKNNLKAIEDVFRDHQLLLRRVVTRYHAFNVLFESNIFDLNPNQVSVIVDIGDTRVRLYIVSDGIKMYRRMPIRLTEKFKSSAKKFDFILSNITSFIESAMDSYVLKHSNQAIHSIFLMTDECSLAPLLKSKKINGIPLKELPMNAELFLNNKVKDNASYLYHFGVYLMHRSSNSFNLIPFMKRFERFAIRAIAAMFLIGFVYILSTGLFSFFSLKKELATYKTNQSSQITNQAKKKREMVAMRNRINKQKKIIDYSDLTTRSYETQFGIDDFLYDLTSISSSDISFSVMRVRNNKLTMSGSSSSLNGNYSFYMFLQKLEAIPYLGRVHYTLGLGGGLDLSSFTIEVLLKTNE